MHQQNFIIRFKKKKIRCITWNGNLGFPETAVYINSINYHVVNIMTTS